MRSTVFALLFVSAAVPAAFAESGTVRLDDGNVAILGEEVDLSQSVVSATLRHAGYRQIHFMKRNEFSVSAFDREGSEVILQIDPRTGGILTSRFVHDMDR